MRTKSGVLRCLAGALVIAIATATPGLVAGKPRAGCSCPQTSGGWLLFPDSSLRTPDFWWQDAVVVQEVTTCRHGIQFKFMAEERGNPYLVALVFTTPPAASRRRGEPFKPVRSLAVLRSQVNEVMGPELEAFGRLDFKHVPMDQRPLIVQPSRRLLLEWEGREVELRGYLDVYMTLLI
jgi:hypothetical protein